jgi:ATP-binding protein involved in chromosome partitioning
VYSMRQIRGYHEVADPATEDIVAQVTAQSERLRTRLRTIHRIIVIGSGKGGVGKSAITANLASVLARRGFRTGALDADLNGPSLARMLGASGKAMRLTDQGLEPVQGIDGVTLVSTDLLLPDATPLGWRHPSAPTPDAGAPAFVVQSMYEGTALRELLSDVEWGELDFLLVDAPPGTDKLERLLQLLPNETVHLLVTTPSQIARNVVARSVTLLRRHHVTAGLVVNMASHVCERCGHAQPLFGAATNRQFAAEAGIELWGTIPFDPRLAAATDSGLPYQHLAPDAPAARALSSLATHLGTL